MIERHAYLHQSGGVECEYGCAEKFIQTVDISTLGRSSSRDALSLESRVIVLVSCLWHALDLGSTHRVGPILAELMDLLETTRDPGSARRAAARPAARRSRRGGRVRSAPA